ncbi:hypothetical protein BaRGS_00024386 [Batillaria attramentaria]|uniref:Uncharacterized protein n=1 Tax=Batillaria attramentaria TaxID=370345 RepID=A0ABD0KBA6_9CAEN
MFASSVAEHVIWHCPFGRIGGFIFTAILIGVLISSCRGHAISLLLQPYAKCLETCAIHLRSFSYQLRERYLSLGRRDLGRDEMHARGDGSAMGISPNRARLGGEARGVVRMLDILRGQRGDAGSLCGPGTAAGCNNRIDSPCVAPNSAPPPPYSSSESVPSPQQSAQIPTPAPPSYRSCTDLVAELNSVRNVACPPSYDTSVEVAPPPSYESLFKDGDSSGVCG